MAIMQRIRAFIRLVVWRWRSWWAGRRFERMTSEEIEGWLDERLPEHEDVTTVAEINARLAALEWPDAAQEDPRD